MALKIYSVSVLVVLLTILQYACNSRSPEPKATDATAGTWVYPNVTSGQDGVESADPASNTGASGFSSSGVAGSDESSTAGVTSTTSVAADASTDERTSDNGEAIGVVDSGDALQSQDGSAPNSPECPTDQPQLGYICNINSQIVCRYGATLCVCQELQWLCSSSQSAPDAAIGLDARVEQDAADHEGEEGEGPRWARTDGGTRGGREGGQGRSHDASAEH